MVRSSFGLGPAPSLEPRLEVGDLARLRPTVLAPGLLVVRPPRGGLLLLRVEEGRRVRRYVLAPADGFRRGATPGASAEVTP